MWKIERHSDADFIYGAFNPFAEFFFVVVIMTEFVLTQRTTRPFALVTFRHGIHWNPLKCRQQRLVSY